MTRSVLGIDVGRILDQGGACRCPIGAGLNAQASVPTPQPATPEQLMAVFSELDAGFTARGAVGLALPSVVQRGVTRTAANIDKSWLGFDCGARLRERLGRPVTVVNDADAAGLAEMKWGAGRGTRGVVIMLTFGTGIGAPFSTMACCCRTRSSATLRCMAATPSSCASARVRTVEKLDWAQWAARVNEYLRVCMHCSGRRSFILGGAVSENFAQFGPLLKSPAEIRAAQFLGQAGLYWCGAGCGAVVARAEELS